MSDVCDARVGILLCRAVSPLRLQPGDGTTRLPIPRGALQRLPAALFVNSRASAGGLFSMHRGWIVLAYLREFPVTEISAFASAPSRHRALSSAWWCDRSIARCDVSRAGYRKGGALLRFCVVSGAEDQVRD